jgi:hypothetical protein
MCNELDRLRRHTASALLEAKQIRLSRDVSIYEDTELCREGHRRIYALIIHLLVGHDGHACPAGDRPIVTATAPELWMSTEIPLACRNTPTLTPFLQRRKL